MSSKVQPQSREALISDLTQRAVSLFGQERAGTLRQMIEETADHMLAISSNLPQFEEVPTLTWHNHP